MKYVGNVNPMLCNVIVRFPTACVDDVGPAGTEGLWIGKNGNLLVEATVPTDRR